MSATQCNLSQPPYNYDMVVAISEQTINRELQSYLNESTYPEIIQYWVYGSDGKTEVIAQEDLLKLTDNIDPLGVPQLSLSNPTFLEIASSKFAYALKAQIGLPEGYQPSGGSQPDTPFFPNVISFLPATNEIEFSLFCSKFVVVRAEYDDKGKITNWINRQQHKGDAWLFTSKIPALNIPISPNEEIPSAVKESIAKMAGDNYTAKKLFLELDKAMLFNIPEIKDVEKGSDLYNALIQVFVKTYLEAMRTIGIPPLSYSITTNKTKLETITPSSIVVEASPYVGLNGEVISNPSTAQKEAASVCYLSAVNNSAMPKPLPFNWNWFDTNVSGQPQGYVAISKAVFVKYLKDSIIDVNLAKNLCITPAPNIHLKFKFELKKIIDDILHWHWKKVPDSLSSGNLSLGWKNEGRSAAFKDENGSDGQILSFSWGANGSDDSHEEGVKLGSWEVKYKVDSSVKLKGTQILIHTHFVMHSDLEVLKFGEAKGNWVDITVDTVYDIGVFQGKLTISKPKTSKSKNEGKIGENWVIDFLNKIDSDITLEHIVDTFNEKAELIVAQYNSNLENAINGLQDFIFPTGKAFNYISVCFSQHLDLIAEIGYQE